MWEPSGILSKFVLKTPVILHGKTPLGGLKNFSGTKVAVIHGTSLSEYAVIKLKSTFSALDTKFFQRSWKNEPSIDSIQQTLSEIESYKPDVILAIGGGSVIDGAKVVRLFYEFPYYSTNSRNNDMLRFSTKFIVVPTTIGSGAEISSAAVLYNESEKRKEFIVSHSFLPEVIVLDTNLIVESSNDILFRSLLDAISHIIEGYVSKIDNVILDAFAEKALQLINDNWKIFSEEKNDEAAFNLQLASVWAGAVQNHCIVGAAHGLAHQLSSYGFGHSTAIGLVLEQVIIANSSNSETNRRYNSLSRAAGLNGGKDGLLKLIFEIKKIATLENKLQKFKNLRPEILSNEMFFKNALADLGAKGNPIPLSRELYNNILESIE